ncbi:large subunit GTPase 1 homolog [Penaeus japonicus]|uniref:large subunit GTPase 1 homolog n=1 Tax=Penaeus japonicus TaxID=27405 RepID=UPI001C710283|nr:large subunit GTPase 1 homolog [Penaeus japonicus]
MGKKGAKGSGLGRSIIKDRFAGRHNAGSSLLHTSELGDGQDWNRINFASITEQTDVDDFLATAELAGTEFQAEKLNMKFVPPSSKTGMLTESEKKKIKEAQDANKEYLRIPRRPHWNITTTAEELAQAERDSFLEWRRSLVQLQEVDGLTLTPFEKNLEFWRQLWRVIERSDVVVQIVDARNPLLFRCEDLEVYVKEVAQEKDNLLLVNKADFLTKAQRESWALYFRENNIKAVFFSALSSQELDEIQEEEEEEHEEEEESDEDDGEGPAQDLEESDTGVHNKNTVDSNVDECRKDLENLSMNLKSENCPSSESVEDKNALEPVEDKITSSSCAIDTDFVTSDHLFSRSELMEVFRTIHTKKKVSEKAVTIGLVGYPNVGKSSTINCLLLEKKVSVSSTPGKTKHFQTLYLTDNIILCDCPGLVFPGFVSTKQEMIISGILPIDQMRDEVPPVNLVASRIPRNVIENIYNITLPSPKEGEDPDRPPTCEELLNTYGFMRGFMTKHGRPDNPRTARVVLKDYMNGKLLYAHAPPNVSQEEYHKHTLTKVYKSGPTKPTPQQIKNMPYQIRPEMVDQKFFGRQMASFHIKDTARRGGAQPAVRIPGNDGPKTKRQKNFKKKEKLRRRYAHLDE